MHDVPERALRLVSEETPVRYVSLAKGRRRSVTEDAHRHEVITHQRRVTGRSSFRFTARLHAGARTDA